MENTWRFCCTLDKKISFQFHVLKLRQISLLRGIIKEKLKDMKDMKENKNENTVEKQTDANTELEQLIPIHLLTKIMKVFLTEIKEK